MTRTYDIAVDRRHRPAGQGPGLPVGAARARVVIGSRSAERAAEAAAEIAGRGSPASVSGAANADAARRCRRRRAGGAVRRARRPGRRARGPAGRQGRDLLREPARLRQAGPLRPRRRPVAAPPRRQPRWCPSARVVGAFHHVSAVTLWGDEEYLDHEDVLVCGDDADARRGRRARPGRHRARRRERRPAADGPPARAADRRADQRSTRRTRRGRGWRSRGCMSEARSVRIPKVSRNLSGIGGANGHPTSQSLLTSQGELALPAAYMPLDAPENLDTLGILPPAPPTDATTPTARRRTRRPRPARRGSRAR